MVEWAPIERVCARCRVGVERRVDFWGAAELLCPAGSKLAGVLNHSNNNCRTSTKKGRGQPKSNSIRLIVAGYGELGFMGCPQSCLREYIHRRNTRPIVQESHLLRSQPACYCSKKVGRPCINRYITSLGKFFLGVRHLGAAGLSMFGLRPRVIYGPSVRPFACSAAERPKPPTHV